jgi:hypothetical protein
MVDWVNSGSDVARLITAAPSHFDIVFVEDLLPGMDGYEIVRLMDSIGCPAKCLFAIRGSSDGEPRADWSSSVAGFIFYPYSPWQVLFSVEQIIYRDVERRVLSRQDQL